MNKESIQQGLEIIDIDVLMAYIKKCKIILIL